MKIIYCLWLKQGKADNFLTDNQLLPDNFMAACAESKSVAPLTLRMQEVRNIFVYIIICTKHWQCNDIFGQLSPIFL